MLIMVHPLDPYKHFGAFLHMMVHSLDRYKHLQRMGLQDSAAGGRAILSRGVVMGHAF